MHAVQSSCSAHALYHGDVTVLFRLLMSLSGLLSLTGVILTGVIHSMDNELTMYISTANQARIQYIAAWCIVLGAILIVGTGVMHYFPYNWLHGAV